MALRETPRPDEQGDVLCRRDGTKCLLLPKRKA